MGNAGWVVNKKYYEETTTYNTDKDPSDDALKYIDTDSFVDMYIVNELFKIVDFGYSSVKFYTK